MKVLLLGASYHEYVYSIKRALEKFDYTCEVFDSTGFYQKCNYIKRKLHKLGIKRFEQDFISKREHELKAKIDSFKPDVIFFLNSLDVMSNDIAEYIKTKNICLGIWLIDSIRNFTEYEAVVSHFNYVYSFEKNDVKYIEEKYSKKSYYVPITYDSKYFYSDNTEKSIDVCFVGEPRRERMEHLVRIAQYASEHNISFHVQGRYYKEKYIWKKKRFDKKYPGLLPYVHNGWIPFTEVADLYRKSKICINIGVNGHNDLNPRTFEIASCGTMLLMDRNNTEPYFTEGRDYIYFSNIEDMLESLDRYLKNGQCCREIAQNAVAKSKEFSIEAIIKNNMKDIFEL